MNIRAVLIAKRLAELQKGIALPEVLAALQRAQSAREWVVWIDAIRAEDERAIGRATLRMIREYLLLSARADADELISGDKFTAAQVEAIIASRSP